MSSRSPHHHLITRKDSELSGLIAQHQNLREHLAKTPKVSEFFDVPDTAGYAKNDDDDVVFIDRHLAHAAPVIDEQPYSVWRKALIDHEWMEKGLVQLLGYEYEAAHEFASLYENRTVRRLSMKPFRYNKALAPYIKRDLLERITKAPKNLDCTPYKPPHQTSSDRKIMSRFAELGVGDAMPEKPPEKQVERPAPAVVHHSPADLAPLRAEIAGIKASIDRLADAILQLATQSLRPPTITVNLPHPRKTRKKIQIGRDSLGNLMAISEDATETVPSN